MELCCIGLKATSGSLGVLNTSGHAKCHRDPFPRGRIVLLVEILMWASLGRPHDGWMSLSLISCSSLGSGAQLIFWALFFVALPLVKNSDVKGHLPGWSGVNICITIPFQETNTDFNQCCWWLYTVSTTVPLAHFCNCTGTPTQLMLYVLWKNTLTF